MPNITKSYVDGLKCRDAAYVKWDSKLAGFGVRVYARDPKGKCKKSFVLRYANVAGKRRMMVLGQFGAMTVTEAREKASRASNAIRDGNDPLEEKKTRRRAVLSEVATFGQVVDKYIELRARPRQRAWKQTRRVLEVNCADWLQHPIASITQTDAQDLLEGFLSKGQEGKAHVTHAWLRAIFRWAENRGVVETSIMNRVEIEIEPKVRDRVYSDDEIKSVWGAANTLDPIEGGFVKLILLLGVRKLELAGMKRKEFDDSNNPTHWTVPHERVKIRKSATKRRVYEVPLPPLAQRIIKSLPRLDDELVFPGRQGKKPLIPGTALKTKVHDSSGVKDWTYHTCRDTVATWLENEGHSEYERGLVLNHSAYGVTAGYSHGYPVELKRKLLEKWADHVADIVQPQGVAVLS